MPKKPNKAAELEKSLAAANAEIEVLKLTVKDREDELAAFRSSQGRNDSALSDVQSQLATAINVLKPFAEKTKEWEAWPPLNASVARRLTWGEIKAAADVAVALTPVKPGGGAPRASL